MNLFSAAAAGCFILLASPTVLTDACTTSSDCGVGGVCARSEATAEAGLVCCPSGDSEYISSLPSPKIVCTGLATGLACAGDNDVCASALVELQGCNVEVMMMCVGQDLVTPMNCAQDS